MDLRIEKENDVVDLNVGDIVEIDILEDSYILMRVPYSHDMYELRSFDGITGACGKKTLKDMKDFVKRNNGVIYKSTSYDLILKPKQ